MPGFLNRHRAAQLMKEQGLSALVLAQPESITYATGAFPGVASFWRRAGPAFVVVPADETVALVAIVGDLQAKSFAAQSGIDDVRTHRIWVETETYPVADATKPVRSPRPAQFELVTALDLLRDVLAERGLLNQRIGLELGFVPVIDFNSFSRIPVEWVDCTRIVERLRSIKCADEIGFLRHAAEYARDGVAKLTRSITAGMDAVEMTRIWKSAVHDSAVSSGGPAPQSTWSYIAVGGDGFAPGGPARPGDIIKVDVGCVINGYSSDGGRTAVLGKPSSDAKRIFDALHRAFAKGFALLRPGMALKDIYHITSNAMWDQGYQTYGRGHFGHGVGASIWSEEWPFIAANSDAVLEPNMVLAFEVPWYIDGLGGFIIEDQVLITEAGTEVMGPSPREMIALSQN